MAFPVAAVTIPRSLAGATNGKLADSLLVNGAFPGRAAGRAHRNLIPAWEAIAKVARDEFGETLTVTSSADAYRSYAIQEATFRSRYTTTELPGRPSKVWNGERWWQKPGTAMAAVPGTSNHGWGLALDICLWRDGAAIGITANKALFKWLLENAARYGFSWEAQSEPWHIRYYAGDGTPPALVPPPKPPKPEPEPLPEPQPDPIIPIDDGDDDMTQCVDRDGDYYLTDWVRRSYVVHPGNDLALIALLWEFEDQGVKFASPRGSKGQEGRIVPVPFPVSAIQAPTFDKLPMG